MIPNASFDGNATLKTSTSNGGVYQPEDWTVAYPTTETWDQSRVVTSLDAVNPANGTKFIYTRLRWATNSYNLSTTTTEELPAGYYALSFSYISPTAATYPVTATVKTGNVSKVVTLAKTSATTWTTKNILFQIEEGEKATINVHLDHKDGNDEGILYLDNFGLKRVTDYMNEIEDIVVEEDNNLIIQDGFVVTKDNTPITIFDLSGRIISSNNRLQPGIYVIKYSDKTKKIIIE